MRKVILIPLHDAQTIAATYIEQLMHHCDRISVSGDIRRHEPNVKDIDIICIPRIGRDGTFTHAQHCIGFREALSGIGVIMQGSSTDSYTGRKLKEGPTLHLYMAKPENWGFVLAISTGCEWFIHNRLAPAWKAAGYKQQANQLLATKGDIPMTIKEESELFSLLRMPYIYPEQRIPERVQQ